MTATIAAPPVAATAPQPPRRRIDLANAGRTAVGVAIVIVAYELLARFVLGGIIAPPSGIARASVDNWNLYQRAVRTTAWAAIRGCLWGNLAAVLLASLVALVAATERVVLRLSLMVFCLPLVAMGPILRVVWGPGAGPQVSLAALAVFNTTLVPVLVGFRAVPQSWTDLIPSSGRGRFRVLASVRARVAGPYFFAGLQVAAPASFLGALVSEFSGADRGVGILTINSMRALKTDELWRWPPSRPWCRWRRMWSWGPSGVAVRSGNQHC